MVVEWQDRQFVVLPIMKMSRWPGVEFGVLCCLTMPGLRKDFRRQIRVILASSYLLRLLLLHITIAFVITCAALPPVPNVFDQSTSMDQLIAGFIKHQQSILGGDKSEEVMAKQKYCIESLLKERKKPLDECQEELVALMESKVGKTWKANTCRTYLYAMKKFTQYIIQQHPTS